MTRNGKRGDGTCGESPPPVLHPPYRSKPPFSENIILIIRKFLRNSFEKRDNQVYFNVGEDFFFVIIVIANSIIALYAEESLDTHTR